MGYKIIAEEYSSKKQIHTIISGLLNEINRDMVATETVKKMRRENISNVIWDIRETTLDYSLTGSHLVIADIAKLELMNTDHIAVVYRNNEEQHERASNVAFNRGINIRYFKDDIKAAHEWLLDIPK